MEKTITRRWFAILRRLRRRGQPGWAVLQVLTLAATLFLVSGFARGTEPDALAASILQGLLNFLRGLLESGWMHPALAEMVIQVVRFASFITFLLLLAALVCRIPSYVGFFILAEFHRRQGHSISALELLLGVSLPIALTLSLACYGVASILATLACTLIYSYIRFSNDPVRMDAILNWYVRIRTAVDTSIGDVEDTDDDVDEAA